MRGLGKEKTDCGADEEMDRETGRQGDRQGIYSKASFTAKRTGFLSIMLAE